MDEGSHQGTARESREDSKNRKRSTDEASSSENLCKKAKASSDHLFLSKDETVHKLVFKAIRKSSESKYDHTSPYLRKTRMIRPPHKIKKKKIRDGSDPPKTLSNPPETLSQSDPPETLSDLPESRTPPDVYDLHCPQDDTEKGDILQCYVHSLKQFKAFVPCEHSLHTFVLQDFNVEHMDLKQQYEFVSRRAFYFEDGVDWIYWCSCDKPRSALLPSLSHCVEVSYLDLAKGQFLHAIAAMCMMEEIDGVHGIAPVSDFSDHKSHMTTHNSDLTVISENIVRVGVEKALCVDVQHSFGVVCLRNQGLVCVTCKLSTCKHVSHLRKVMDDATEEELDIFADFKTSDVGNFISVPQVKKISHAKIPFILPMQLKCRLKEDPSKRFNLCSGIACLCPSLPTSPSYCPECASVDSWSENLYLLTESFLVTLTCCIPSKVYIRRCTMDGCSAKLFYDGQVDCVINMGVFCIAYEVLRNHMYHFLYGRTTMFTEYSILQRMHSDIEEQLVLNAFKYHHFRKAWYSFMQLLDINYSEGFSCNLCGTTPSTFIMDATSVSFRKALDSWRSFVCTIQSGAIRSGRFSERIFIQDKETRSLLKEFSSKGLIHDKLMYLDSLLPTHASSLVSLFQYLKHNTNTSLEVMVCPQEWSKLIGALSSPSPVCALVHPSETNFDLLKKLKTEDVTKDPIIMELLQREIPVIFDLLATVSHFPKECFAPIIDVLIDKADAPFSRLAPPATEAVPDAASLLHDLAYFPVLPQIRERGTYESDRHNSKIKGCTKQSTGHPSLLPGIFTLYCPRGICYGFQVMRIHESPAVPFSVLYTRLIQAPDLVVYDNACNLHNYILNRVPSFFRKTWFLVDRFHWKNHTACSVGYQMNTYPQFSSINSEVVEQANSMIQRIKGSVSYMTAENFMNHLKLFYWYHNQEKNASLS